MARSFMDAFPDIQVYMDDVAVNGDTAEFDWTSTGTNTGPVERHLRTSAYRARLLRAPSPVRRPRF